MVDQISTHNSSSCIICDILPCTVSGQMGNLEDAVMTSLQWQHKNFQIGGGASGGGGGKVIFGGVAEIYFLQLTRCFLGC